MQMCTHSVLLPQSPRRLRFYLSEPESSYAETRGTVTYSSIPQAAQFNSCLSRNVYLALAQLRGGSQLKKTPGQTVHNGPRPHQWAIPRYRPALITSASSGDRLPFTVVCLAIAWSLVQYGSTFRPRPGPIRLRAIGLKWDLVPLSLYCDGPAISPQ